MRKRDSWHDRKIEELGRVGMLATLSTSDLDDLIRLADESAVAPGYALLEQGRRARWAYLLLDGSALAVQDGAIVGKLGSGDLIGGDEVRSLRPAPYTVVAEWDVRVLS